MQFGVATNLERRGGDRHEIDDTRVAFSTVSRGERRLVIARVLDLSRTGALVHVPQQHIRWWPPIRSAITPLVLNFDGDQTIDCQAEVVWLDSDRGANASDYRSGLHFKAMAPEDEVRLRAYIATLEQALSLSN